MKADKKVSESLLSENIMIRYCFGKRNFEWEVTVKTVKGRNVYSF